jgi:multicomponent K+:H+ antiporter subunit A
LRRFVEPALYAKAACKLAAPHSDKPLRTPCTGTRNSTASNAMLTCIPLLPWLAVPLLALIPSHRRKAGAWIAAAANGIALAHVLVLAPQVFDGETVVWRVAWVPSAGLELALRLDGLALLFALLILAIGLLIILYAAYYLGSRDSLPRLYAQLMLFTGAMLGAVLSENLLLLFVFWELTSISSFLLIGYWHQRADARDGARVALAVTGAGGLAMLAGFLLLGRIAGSHDLSVILASGDAIRASPLYLPALVLILFGAFTKSAQFPFHFWLPGAMAAPTPVSAYLHSATMVKLGVFLLARLFPVLSGTDAWFLMVSGVGLVTLVFGAYQALFKHDLKSLLAYSTVSHLGLITLLFGMGSPLSAVAGVFHVINHATFKASLFMAAGIIDHETGTRDMRRINGLWRYMPFTGLLAMVAAGAMAGVPLLNGFLSKEMFFEESLALGGAGPLQWLVPAGALLAGVFSVAYSARFIHDVFFNGEPVNLPRKPHEPPRWMRAPVEVLVVVCLLVGIVPSLTIAPLLEVSARSVLGGQLPQYSLAVWHGLTPALVMSAVALAGGATLYFLLQYRFRLHHYVASRHTAKRVFDRVLIGVERFSRWVTQRLHDGSLRRSLLPLALVAVAAGAYPFWAHTGLSGGGNATPLDAAAVAGWLLLLAAAGGTVVLHRQRLAALMLAAVVGLVMSLTFAYFSAPDLALTQISVEVVTTLLMLLALNLLPQGPLPDDNARGTAIDLMVSVAAGAGVAALAWAVMTRPLDSISAYFLERSVPDGGGSNVVNVILVDFRGFDTFGEIVVIAIAALGIAALLAGVTLQRPNADGHGRPFAADAHTLILRSATRLLLPLALLVSAYIFVRGHNDPGGGFIAALVTAVALIAQYLASGIGWASARLRVDYQRVLAIGVLIAGGTGVAAWLFGAPFLTSAHGHPALPLIGEVPLASAALFDLGVYLTVVGGTMLVLAELGRAGGDLGADA